MIYPLTYPITKNCMDSDWMNDEAKIPVYYTVTQYT
jgi:hypothetical protein